MHIYLNNSPTHTSWTYVRGGDGTFSNADEFGVGVVELKPVYNTNVIKDAYALIKPPSFTSFSDKNFMWLRDNDILHFVIDDANFDINVDLSGCIVNLNNGVNSFPLMTSFGKYWLNANDQNELYNKLTKTTFDITHLFTDASQGVLTFRYYPLDTFKYMQSGITDSITVLGKKIVERDVANIGVVKNEIFCFRIASFSMIAYNYNKKFYYGDKISFLDFYPYTVYKLMLPMCDVITLNGDDILGKQIVITLSISIITGIGTYRIYANGILINSIDCNFGVDIPLGATNANEITKNQLSSLLGIGGAIVGGALGSAPLAVGAILSGANSFLNASQVRANLISCGGSENGITLTDKVVLFIAKNKCVYPDEIKNFKGRPSQKYALLKDVLSVEGDYCEIDDSTILSPIGDMVTEEFTELKNIMREGFYV